MRYTAISIEIKNLESEIEAKYALLKKAMLEDKPFAETKEMLVNVHTLQKPVAGITKPVAK